MLKDTLKQCRTYIAGLNNLIPADDRHKYGIKDLIKNSYLSIGKENYIVIDVSTYLEVKWSNFKKKKSDYIITELKLFSLSSGEIKFVEWEEDDFIEAYVTTKTLNLRDIQYNGLKVTKNILDEIAEKEEGILSFNNTKFYYEEEDTFAALYNSDKHSNIPVRIFEFYSNRGESLSVECWYDDNEDSKPEKEAFLSTELNLDTVSVLQL